MRSLFVTGSGTGVGKTYVTAGLAAALRDRGRDVRVIKPVVSGYPGDDLDETDTARLLAALGLVATAEYVEACSPWRFEAPLSPDMAAAREDRAIDFGALVGFCRAAAKGPEDVLLIEGIGGVMVPLDDHRTVLDWIVEMAAPTLVVAGPYLGTLNHALMAVEVLKERNVTVAGVAVSESEESPVPLAETVATLQRFLGAIPVAAVARDAGPGAVYRALSGLTGV